MSRRGVNVLSAALKTSRRLAIFSSRCLVSRCLARYSTRRKAKRISLVSDSW